MELGQLRPPETQGEEWMDAEAMHSTPYLKNIDGWAF